MASAKEIIAYRVAQDLKDGDVINLGIGLPTMVANYIPEGVEVTIQSENGILGMDRVAKEGEELKDVINSGGQPVLVNPGACYFDSAMSFSSTCRAPRTVTSTWPPRMIEKLSSEPKKLA